MSWEKLCKELQLRVKELEKENRELRCRLCLPEEEYSTETESYKSDVLVQPITPALGVYMRSTPEEKIRLFRSLFRGREDVFARRWYAVIDKSTLWYGGINFLGFEKTAHGAMRLCSEELAKELMGKIHCEQEVQMALPDV